MATIIDKKYLSLQFKDRVHRKNGSEFQSFFEDVMQKAFPCFKKIRPYGNEGDGGNDGYVPDQGVYCQVYAPKDPKEKDADAAKKFRNNFNTLKEKWNEISKIKVYNFVFNDKYSGSSIELETVKSELKTENPDIEFNIFYAKDFEQIFERLDKEQLSSLEFDVDSRNALKNAKEYLQKLEIELDRGNAPFVSKTLETLREVITEQGDDALKLDYELMEAITSQRLEKFDEAQEEYENIYKRFPKDVRAPLYLAEFYLNIEDYDENERLLNEAKKIDATYWLYPLEILIREHRLGKLSDSSRIDEKKFPDDPRIKADYYRLASLFFERSEDFSGAESFIERAIKLNPEKFSHYNVKLGFLEQKLVSIKDKEKQAEFAQQFLNEIEIVFDKFKILGGLSARNHIYLNIKKFPVFQIQENYTDFGEIAKETFELALNCYFDITIDRVLTSLLQFIELPQNDFEKLLAYLTGARKRISDDLAKAIFLQFLHKNTLSSDGKIFFNNAKKDKIVELINNIESGKYDSLESVLKEDVHFAVALCVSAKSIPELRKKIIEILPNDGTIQKEKLLLLLDFDEGNIDEAFSILKSLDLSKLSYVECLPTVDIAEKKKAWDFVIILLNKLLQYEKEARKKLQIKLRLFTANLNLDKLPEVISIGEQILGDKSEISLLDEENQEILTAQTAQSWLKRGKYSEAKDFIEKYGHYLKKFEAKVFLEAEIYIKNKEPKLALKAVIEGVKFLKRPSPEEYGSLFLIFTEIENLMSFPLVSLDKVEPNSFIKFKDEDKWVFIGNNEELDAIKVLEANQIEYLGKKVGEKIVSSSKYRSAKTERVIENILPIEKYILWQSFHNAQKLSLEGAWDKMEIIEVPQTEGGGIDPKYLIAKLEEQNKRGQEFFNTYCQQNIPFALLAFSEGGIPNAIGRLINEQKGYIKSSVGTLQEMEEQKKIASQIIDGQTFYIDGMSAIVLSETGILEKIYQFLPNLKVPQSVISLLLELKEKFSYSPGQVGQMYYAQGKIGLSDINQERRERIENNFKKSIEIFESKPGNIEAISSINKSETFSEKQVFPCLADACIFAQRDSSPVLTEDFLYLQMNEIETKKTKPKYCSSFAIIRVLFEQKKISFEEYLNFFSYLSSYRFRFLPIITEDLEMAVFGDEAIKVVKVENLKKFNFSLTLSEDYGVTFRTATRFILHFLIKLLIDDSVPSEVLEKIFAEIITTFPTKKDKKIFGRSLITVSVQLLNKNRHLILGTKIQEKIDALSRFIEIYSSEGIIQPFS